MSRPLAAALVLLACASCMVQGPATTAAPAATLPGSDTDLVAELVACDAMAPTDPGYPEARARAREVEARLRESHQLFHEGLLLRSEGRDQAALHCFHAARALWPEMPGLADWIRATEARQRIFVATASDPVMLLQSAVPLPEAQAVPDEVQPAPGAEPALPVRNPAGSRDALLASVDSLLREGDLDGAITMLRGGGGAVAREPWRRQPLFTLLRQRGLLAYGRGDLDRAITDWVDTLELDPTAGEVRDWLGAATKEAADLAVRGARTTASR